MRCWKRPASLIIGGPDFGVYGEGFLRLSYANSTPNIRKALQRIADFLGREKPPV